jgi:hypothetical protein
VKGVDNDGKTGLAARLVMSQATGLCRTWVAHKSDPTKDMFHRDSWLH